MHTCVGHAYGKRMAFTPVDLDFTRAYNCLTHAHIPVFETIKRKIKYFWCAGECACHIILLIYSSSNGLTSLQNVFQFSFRSNFMAGQHHQLLQLSTAQLVSLISLLFYAFIMFLELRKFGLDSKKQMHATDDTSCR